ncbi:hypothetical protein Dimus_016662 [Dionaea muscipula]
MVLSCKAPPLAASTKCFSLGIDIRVFTPAFVNKETRRFQPDFHPHLDPLGKHARDARSGGLVGVQVQVDLWLPFLSLYARRCFLCFSGGPLGIFSSFGTRSGFSWSRLNDSPMTHAPS